MKSLEPWPESVELKDILADLLACNQRHIYQKEDYMFVDVMYVVMTYTYQHFEFCPILYITSPVPGCGKTTSLDWFKKYCKQPRLSGNISASSLFRTVDEEKPTMLIDELDTINDEMRREIGNLLNNGYQKEGGGVMRVENTDNGGREPKSFDVYGPKIVSCIGAGSFSDATASRSIHKRMGRRPKDRGRPFRISRIDSADVCRKLFRWAKDNKEMIEKRCCMDLPIPEKLTDREADMWEGLFILSKFAGQVWEERMYNAAIALTGSCKDDTVSMQELILQHCQNYILFKKKERITSEDFANYINRQSDWKEYPSQNLTPHKLASLLRDFGVFPKVIHFPEKGGKKYRGYEASSFEDAFQSYLSPYDPSETVTA